ncbi:3-oxoacyl-[acyl-carrier-protein] synthase III C-terminal domain-containing protein [Pajaroellobacter abortibovis]
MGCLVAASSTIPIALCRSQNRSWEDMRVMLVGFGVGYLWSATLVR